MPGEKERGTDVNGKTGEEAGTDDPICNIRVVVMEGGGKEVHHCEGFR